MVENAKQIEDILYKLTEDEKQLLKDTINKGFWGDCEYEFANKDTEEFEETWAYGFCTNDAKEAGHFAGRQISAMFRSIYRKLCEWKKNTTGEFLSHCRDWWGDGSGDMLFIRSSYRVAFQEWAKN